MVPWIHMSWPNRLPCFLLSLLYIKNDNRYCLYSAYYLSGTGYFTYINSLNPINMKMNLDREQQKYYVYFTNHYESYSTAFRDLPTPVPLHS